jgi:hypothetical protein
MAGWEVAAPGAYPVLIAINTAGGGITRETAEDLTLLLRAIPEFVAHHRDLLDPDTAPASTVWRSPATGVRLHLQPGPQRSAVPRLWEPVERLAPCLPQGPGADPEAALDAADEAHGGPDALVEREGEVVNHFAAALRRSGLGEATVRKHADNAAVFVEMLAFFEAVPVRAVTEYDLRSFLFDLYPRKVRDVAYRAEAMPASLVRFFDFLAEHEGIVCPWAGAVLGERDEYRERIATFPGGAWWDEGVTEWREILDVDLIERAMIHWPRHADGTPWGPMMGPVEAMLEREVQRGWLLWRDEAIHGGLTDPHEVRQAATERQLQWEQMPHPRLGGRTPLQSIEEERQERGPMEVPELFR